MKLIRVIKKKSSNEALKNTILAIIKEHQSEFDQLA